MLSSLKEFRCIKKCYYY